MRIPDEMLMAYVDEELTADERAAIERAANEDPELGRRIAEQRALRERLRAAYAPVLHERVPEPLLRALRPSASSTAENVVPMRPRRAPKAQLAWRWGALAASLVLGILAGHWLPWRAGSGPITNRGGQLLARGALASALSHQLAITQPALSEVQIGISYRSKLGPYCRTFVLHEEQALAGLACREGTEWQVNVLASAGAGTGGSAYRRAASALPESVSATVEQQIAGDPLNAEQEAAAQRRGWEPQPGP